MSYQLISADSPSGIAGFRTIAHSPHLPSALKEALALLAQGSMNGDSFYSYCVVKLQSNQYHLLTCGTTKQSSTGTRLVHQLLLSDEEVAGLQQSKARPTPAGLILAFIHNHYWVKDESASPDVTNEPKVSGTDIPDASEQKSWKELTGHKNDVKVFLTQPFDKQFRVSNALPTVADFTTYSLIATNALPPEENHYQEIPILRITPQTQQLSDLTPIIRTTATGEHYQYTECPDYDIFDIPPPGANAFKRNIILCISAFALITGGIGVYVVTEDSENELRVSPQSTEQKFIETISNGDDNQDTRLKELEAELRKQNTAKSAAMLECIRIFTEHAQNCGGHPNNMLALLQHADSVGINGERLCLHYLDKVIESYRQEDWVRENSTAEELAEWKQLFAQSETLKKTLKNNSKYRAFMHDIIRHTDKIESLHH